VKYDVWEQTVPQHFQRDPLWSLRVYRTALFAGELGERDAAWIAKRTNRVSLADQLLRSTESISSNIAEGFSRLGRKDRRRFYEYALGSARESRDWYFKVRDHLGPEAAEARIALHTALIKILTALVVRTRTD
jgi:four helix bundle protein